jgi:predicted PurR-regulated permease PerM
MLESLLTRLSPSRGSSLLRLSEQTIRGVATGVVGVAVIQCLLAGLGFLVADIPGAAVLAIVCLIIGIAQLPITVPITLVIAYMWFTEPGWAAVLFTAWNIPVMMLDNILKPILMGRGVEAPMLVVFIGAIGGLASIGILGLFTGAVLLVVAYELCRVWVYGGEGETKTDSAADG